MKYLNSMIQIQESNKTEDTSASQNYEYADPSEQQKLATALQQQDGKNEEIHQQQGSLDSFQQQDTKKKKRGRPRKDFKKEVQNPRAMLISRLTLKYAYLLTKYHFELRGSCTNSTYATTSNTRLLCTISIWKAISA